MSRIGLRMMVVLLLAGMVLTAASCGQRSPSPPRTVRLAAVGFARENLVVEDQFQIASSLPPEEAVRGNDLATEESGDEAESDNAEVWKKIVITLGLAGGAHVLFVTAAVFFSLVFYSIFLLWGAKLAGIQKRTLTGAIVIAILSGIASFVLELYFDAALSGSGSILAFFAGFLATVLIVKLVFHTTFWKAIFAIILAWILEIVAIGLVVIVLLAAGGA